MNNRAPIFPGNGNRLGFGSRYSQDPELRRDEIKTDLYVLGSLVLLAGAGIGALKVFDHPGHHSQNNPHPAIEKPGDHHGATGMPSTEHLDKFTAEHGITINSK